MTSGIWCPYCRTAYVSDLMVHIIEQCPDIVYEYIVEFSTTYNVEYHGPFSSIEETQQAAFGYIEADCFMTDYKPVIFRKLPIKNHIEFFYYAAIRGRYTIYIQRFGYDDIERLHSGHTYTLFRS